MTSKTQRDSERNGPSRHSLGELEAQILDVIWDIEPPVNTTQVFKVMYPLKELSYSTVMLTMAKLARKGFLVQRRTGPSKTAAFEYTPTVSREQLARRLMEEVAQQIFRKPLTQALMEITK